MPVGDIVGELIAEIVFRPIAAIFSHVFGALGYFSGAAFLTIVSFGRLELAPLDTLFDGGRFDRKRAFSLGIWMDRPGKRRALKAGCVCLIGLLLWIALGIGVYKAVKSREAGSQARPPAVSDESQSQPRR